MISVMGLDPEPGVSCIDTFANVQLFTRYLPCTLRTEQSVQLCEFSAEHSVSGDLTASLVLRIVKLIMHMYRDR